MQTLAEITQHTAKCRSLLEELRLLTAHECLAEASDVDNRKQIAEEAIKIVDVILNKVGRQEDVTQELAESYLGKAVSRLKEAYIAVIARASDLPKEDTDYNAVIKPALTTAEQNLATLNELSGQFGHECGVQNTGPLVEDSTAGATATAQRVWIELGTPRRKRQTAHRQFKTGQLP